jgi:DNA mismatch repair ATPase MutS
MYSNVKNVHLKTTLDAISVSDGNISKAPQSVLRYLHEIETGPCEMRSGYGIIMAEDSGFPQSVLEDARAFRNLLRSSETIQVETRIEANYDDAINNILQYLLILKNSSLDDRSIRLYLQNLRSRIPEEVCQAIGELEDKK